MTFPLCSSLYFTNFNRIFPTNSHPVVIHIRMYICTAVFVLYLLSHLSIYFHRSLFVSQTRTYVGPLIVLEIGSTRKRPLFKNVTSLFRMYYKGAFMTGLMMKREVRFATVTIKYLRICVNLIRYVVSKIFFLSLRSKLCPAVVKLSRPHNVKL